MPDRSNVDRRCGPGGVAPASAAERAAERRPSRIVATRTDATVVARSRVIRPATFRSRPVGQPMRQLRAVRRQSWSTTAGRGGDAPGTRRTGVVGSAACASEPTSTPPTRSPPRPRASAEAVQFFLSRPAGLTTPEAASRRGGAAGAPTWTIYIHAPYRLNVATTEQPHPHPEPQAAAGSTPQAAAEIGAKGLIVHGGHVDEGDDLDVGFDNWRKTFAYAAEGRRLAAADPDREHGRRRQRLRPPVRQPGPAVGRGRRVRRRVLPGHLPRPRRRRGAARHRRPGQGDHRPDRPDPRQRLEGRVRLRRATGTTTSAVARSTRSWSSR